MTNAASGSGLELTNHTKSRHEFKLSVVQQPVTGKAVSSISRARGMKWPIEPPPVLELTSGEKDPQKWLYIHNPNWFCIADIMPVDASQAAVPRKESKESKDSKASKEGGKDNLSGLLASSLHKVKGPDDRNEHGYFVFGDLNVRDAGRYKLKFTLFEMRQYTDQASGQTQLYAAKVDTAYSAEFEIVSSKQSLPSKDSTALSKLLSESGVKIRLRKESLKRKQPTTANWSSTATENLHASHASPISLAPMASYSAMPMGPPMPVPMTGTRAAKSYGEDVSKRLSVVQADMTVGGVYQPSLNSPVYPHVSTAGYIMPGYYPAQGNYLTTGTYQTTPNFPPITNNVTNGPLNYPGNQEQHNTGNQISRAIDGNVFGTGDNMPQNAYRYAHYGSYQRQS